ncbi:MAG: SRPBCC domain-containing protein [Acidimicrobiia bacterium]|jgi:uncharacterized protein YndB with AHSA1/START domain
MSTTTATNLSTTQVFRVYIKADQKAVWDAITDPEWNARYGYQARTEYELAPGGAYRVVSSPEMMSFGAPEVLIDGEILEVDPPKRLVQLWHANFDPDTIAEPATRLTWELVEKAPGMTEVTVTHELAGAPATAVFVSGEKGAEAGGGWSWILSDLKTLLETGASMND